MRRRTWLLRNPRLELVALTTLLLTTACGAPEAGGPGELEAVAATSAALVDASALYPLDPHSRPSPTFSPETRLTRANLRGVLLGSEPVTGQETIGTQTDVFFTPGFRVERRVAEGDLHVTRREPSGPAPVASSSVDPEELRAQATELMLELGVPESELGPRRQRRVLGIDSEDRDARRIVSHATFIARAFHGIEVLGSRAIVVHDAAGGFKRLLLDWPAVADGPHHQWSTSMSVAEIEQRAASELASRGLAGRAATLRYVYAPVATAGDQTYELKCAASIPALPEGHPDGPDKDRRILIDLEP